MLFFRRKKYAENLRRELSGLDFPHPVGVFIPAGAGNLKLYRHARPGFLTLDAPSDAIIPWIDSFQELHAHTPIAVNIRHQIVRTFSLVYDFADLLIIEPDENDGHFSEDAPDTTALLDELLSLRLCYERYTPIYLRLYKGLTPSEITPLLSFCQLSGIDGIVAPGTKKLELVKQATLGRLPVIGQASSTEEALSLLEAGATLVETHLRPLQLPKLMKTVEKQAKKP